MNTAKSIIRDIGHDMKENLIYCVLGSGVGLLLGLLQLIMVGS